MVFASRVAFLLFLSLAALLGVEAFRLLNYTILKMDYYEAQGLNVTATRTHLKPPGSFANIQEYAIMEEGGHEATEYIVTFEIPELLHGEYQLDLVNKNQRVVVTYGDIEAEIVQTIDSETGFLERMMIKENGVFELHLNEQKLRALLNNEQEN